MAAAMSSPSAALALPRDMRVVVCGAGIVGACTAYFLSVHPTPPKSIVVLEKCSPACAASGKAGGFLALDWSDSDPALSSLSRASFQLHQSLAQSLDGQTSYGYRRLNTHSLPVSSSAKSISRTMNLPSWIDGACAGPSRTIGTPETTAQVHPRLFTQTILASALAHGVKVVNGVEVESVVVEDDRVVGVKVKGAEEALMEADVVVVAMGPWSGKMDIMKRLFRVSAIKAHSVVLKPRSPEEITADALFLSYRAAPGGKMLDPEVYPRPDGEVYVCGLSKPGPLPDNPDDITGEKESIEMLHRIAGTVSSHLRREEGAEVLAEQACFLPCTDDGDPIIGEIPGAKGCFVATGHSCWGILNAPATGKSLSELILEGTSSTVNLGPFSPARFIGRRT